MSVVDVVQPRWAELEQIVASAHHRLWLCSPYVKDEALGRVFDALTGKGFPFQVRVWTRLSPSDWASGASDPDSLVSFMTLLQEHGYELELGIIQRLHAKVYAADDQSALLGSANLSSGGFEWNLELAVSLDPNRTAAALALLEAEGEPRLKHIQIPDLVTWVNDHSDAISRAKAAESEEAEALSAAQAALDSILGYGRGSRDGELREPSRDDLDRFARWLEANRELPGADVVVRRHRNTDGQNLTGHVKQSFAGWWRFLSSDESIVQSLSRALEGLDRDDIYPMADQPLVERWSDHFDAHATDFGEDYSYPTLRGLLPPSLGGTREGGGGGISTFKRVGPLVARFIAEKGWS